MKCYNNNDNHNDTNNDAITDTINDDNDDGKSGVSHEPRINKIIYFETYIFLCKGPVYQLILTETRLWLSK